MKKKPIRVRLGRVTSNTCVQNFRAHRSKTAWTLDNRMTDPVVETVRRNISPLMDSVPQVVFSIFFFFFFFSIPFIMFTLLFSLPPSRNSDPG